MGTKRLSKAKGTEVQTKKWKKPKMSEEKIVKPTSL